MKPSAVGLEALRLLIVRVELSRSELRATASFERLKEAPDAAAVVPALFDFPPFLVVAPLRLQRVETGTAHPAPGRGRTGAEAGPAAPAEADRGANVGGRLSRS